MHETYKLILQYMMKHTPNVTKAGQRARVIVPDNITVGGTILMAEAHKYRAASFNELAMESEEADLDIEITAEDISIDLVEDM